MALEREKNKLVLDKCQSILTGLLKDEDNKYCVDCDAKSPRWASWNLGIFLCIRCAGIHRNLGVHISKVKSVNLDTWTPQQVACIQQMGNSRARAVYEANLQDNFRRPQTDSSLEQFIRAKYEAKKYIAREWVPPSLPHPTWDSEIEKQLKKKKEKKSVTGNVEFPVPVKNSTPKSGGVSPKPLPKAPGGRNNSPNQAKRASGASAQKEPTTEKETLSSGTLDLLGLDVPSNTNGVAESDADIFGDFLTAPSASATAASSTASDSKPLQDSKESNQNEESNFFNQKLPDNASAEKLSRDSILALYNQTPPPAPHSHPQPPQQNMYGSGGMFMGAPGMPVGVPPQTAMGAIPPQQQQQQHQTPQNMMFFQQQAQSGAGMQSQFYSAGLPGMGGAMYQGMPGMPPGPAGMPGGVQLSAANPFAQIQAQMGNISLGGMVPPQTQPPPMVNPLLMANTGLSTNPQATTLSTNLWQ